MSSILIGGDCSFNDDPAFYKDFDDYLDQIDRDMMVLNLKACFEILSNLERKTAAIKESHGSIDFGQRKHNNSNQKQKLLRLYRQAWRLHGLQHF